MLGEDWQTMPAIQTFSLAQHAGEYDTWPLESQLMSGSQNTGKTIPGYCLNAQYQFRNQYLFVTSWDCPCEEALEVVLTDDQLDVIDHESIGVIYASVWLEWHEMISDTQLLLGCGHDLQIRVTIQNGILLDRRSGPQDFFKPYPSRLARWMQSLCFWHPR